MITIVVKQQVPAPLEHVSQVLLAHAQLDRFFNAKIKLLKSENDGELVGGKGAIRQIAIGKIVFNEEIISASNEHICYRIVGNWPVSNHQGDIRLTTIIAPQVKPEVTTLGGDKRSTNIDYLIQFKGPKWLPDFLLKFFVGRDIKNAMKKLALYFIAENTLEEQARKENSA
jgi:hypothetical protein